MKTPTIALREEPTNGVATTTYIDQLVANVKRAQQEYATFSQNEVDQIFKAAALAANKMRIPLAKQAVEETGMGVLEDKVIKNHFAAEYIYNTYKNTKTCGVVEDDSSQGFQKIAEPLGVICGIIPTTNPTSTAIFKALLALKTRNGIVFSPHPRAKECTVESVRVILEAAVKAGAPKNIIGWIEEPSLLYSEQIMHHPDVSMILATGGPGMVKAAYSSGKPAIGVGAGNTPAVIDETADIEMAVNSIIMSKTFDNGVICASEQSVIVHKKVYQQVKKLFTERGCYLLNDSEKELVRDVILDKTKGTINPKIVGQTASFIAHLAGVDVDEATQVLIGEVTEISKEEPFAYEKLSPCLALYACNNYKDGIKKAKQLIEFGGPGHTSVYYTSNENTHRVDEFSQALNTGRILVNMPASQGAIGDLYNFRLEPSLTLGCGSWGDNSVSENVGVKHLLNIKTVAKRRENMLWFQLPPKVYFKKGCLPIALKELQGKKRCMLVTDKYLFTQGFTKRIESILKEQGTETECFYQVEPDPSINTINKGLEHILNFNPDVIIGFGGGSPMDAAKIMWLLYEAPNTNFEDISMRFMDIQKKISTFPSLGKKAELVCIPTTSGTGSEITPFSVVTDNKTGMKYPIADYSLTPNMAIIDSELVMSMPKGLTAASGIDALTHALEAYVSVMASDFTNAMALEAIRLLVEYLPSAYKNGVNDELAREKVHHASSMAGMAFGNAFLGICHSLAHKLGAFFHITHGVANAMLIPHIIRYNATQNPQKITPFPQYDHPMAQERYARIADCLNLHGEDDAQKVERLILKVEQINAELDIPKTIKDYGVAEDDFLATLDEMAEQAFDDQCTGTNPRFPLIGEIKELYKKAYYGAK